MVGAGDALGRKISRASARKRRFMRLRTTAPPIFLVTVKPTRIAGSPSSRSRTSRTKPGVGARLPRIGGKEIGALADAWLGAELLAAARAARVEHLAAARRSPCGAGTRAGARGRDCSAGKCASSLMPQNLNEKGPPNEAAAVERADSRGVPPKSIAAGCRSAQAAASFFAALRRASRRGRALAPQAPVHPAPGLRLPALDPDIVALGPDAALEDQRKARRDQEDAAGPGQRRDQRARR